jgi:RNA polymerase sigma-70 factor (ECF subfamily)
MFVFRHFFVIIKTVSQIGYGDNFIVLYVTLKNDTVKFTMVYEHEADEKLVEKYLFGDEKAFDFLVYKYTTPIYNFSARYIGVGQEAEDLTQEIFIKIWKSLKKFDLNKKFKPWIFRIARNTIFDYLRKKKVAPVVESIDDCSDEEPATLLDISPTILEKIKSAEGAVVVWQAVSKLSETYRIVLALYYQEEFSLIEIAGILKEPINTIKSRHRRALIQLKNLLS